MLITDIKKCEALVARIIALDRELPGKFTAYLAGSRPATALFNDLGADPALDALAAALATGAAPADAARHDPVSIFFYLATWLPYWLTYGLTAVFYFNRKEPLVYAHTRYGLGGAPFKMYKFTTMAEDPAKAAASHLQKSAADPAIIRPWGAFLRKTSLNELPQRINLKAGEMAVFGPRPYPEKARRVMEDLGAGKRNLVKPGWISLAHQVHSLYGISTPAMALMDLVYVEFYDTPYKIAFDALAFKYALCVIAGARNK